jgi:lipid-binding SYLF domain-containing protein
VFAADANGRAVVRQGEGSVKQRDAVLLARVADSSFTAAALNNSRTAEEHALSLSRKGHRTSHSELTALLDDDERRVSSLILVLRRTEKRGTTGGSFSGTLNYRLDEECDKATHLLKRLALLPNLPPQPPPMQEDLLNFNTIADFLQPTFDSIADLVSCGSSPALNSPINGIQKSISSSIALIFVRSAKVIAGVGVSAGTGLIIARLQDGTWSSPCAVSVVGATLGPALGVSVTDYLFVLDKRSPEVLSQFVSNNAVSLAGAGIGIALAGANQERYGATVKVDSKAYADLEQITTYSKSSGAFVGISLDGLTISSRPSVNSQLYRLLEGRDVSPKQLLSGEIRTPVEAQALYDTLAAVASHYSPKKIPSIPEHLSHSPLEWTCSVPTVPRPDSPGPSYALTTRISSLFAFHSHPTKSSLNQVAAFEASFRHYLSTGVAVKRLLPLEAGTDARTRMEHRTLQLYLPETGSMSIGYLGRGGGSASQLVPLTEITRVSQIAPVSLTFDPREPTTELLLVSIERFGEDRDASILFLANSFQEATLLIVGLSALLESETRRLGVRGGQGSGVEFEEEQLPPPPPPPKSQSPPSSPEANSNRSTIKRVLGKLILPKSKHNSLRVLLLDPESPLLLSWRDLCGQTRVRYTQWSSNGPRDASESLLKTMAGRQRKVSYLVEASEDSGAADEEDWTRKVEHVETVEVDEPNRFVVSFSSSDAHANTFVRLTAGHSSDGSYTVVVKAKLTSAASQSPDRVHELLREMVVLYGHAGEGLLKAIQGFLGNTCAAKEDATETDTGGLTSLDDLMKLKAAGGAFGFLGSRASDSSSFKKCGEEEEAVSASEPFSVLQVINAGCSASCGSESDDEKKEPLGVNLRELLGLKSTTTRGAGEAPGADESTVKGEYLFAGDKILVKPLLKMNLALLPSPKESDEDDVKTDISSQSEVSGEGSKFILNV